MVKNHCSTVKIVKTHSRLSGQKLYTENHGDPITVCLAFEHYWKYNNLLHYKIPCPSVGRLVSMSVMISNKGEGSHSSTPSFGSLVLKC